MELPPAGIGIDLGSSAVRVGIFDYDNDHLINTASHPVPYKRSVGNDWEYTQCTTDIVNGIEECLEQLKVGNFTVKCCGVAATCSMAVFRQTSNDSLIPYPDDDNNVIFWMDSTAKEESILLNKNVDTTIKNHLGGAFIPEMGVPKLLKLMKIAACDKTVANGELVAFDLHRYIIRAIAVKYNWSYELSHSKPNRNEIGIDGEIGGWSPQFYNSLLTLLPSDYEKKNIKINDSICEMKSSGGADVTLASSIDSYASWYSVFSETPFNTLFMVAGTSTCYMYSLPTHQSTFKGVWGPFTDVVPGKPSYECYSGGFSCTGKLLEHLFLTHPAAIALLNKKQVDLIDMIENRIVEIEESNNCSIHCLTKHLHYYGDLEGNRTPYGDPSLRGMFIGESTDYSFDNLVYKYIIILEFLAFQTKLVVDTLLSNVEKLNDTMPYFIIAGSQAKNIRLLSLVSIMNNDVVIRKPSGNVSLMGVYGMYKISKQLKNSYSCDVTSYPTEGIVSIDRYDNNSYLKTLLLQKYKITKDMVNVQLKYRHLIDSINDENT